MNKKEQMEIKSVVSLLNEILGIVQKDLAIDVANQKKLTELQESCEQLGMKVDGMDKKLDAILVVLLGPQIQTFSLDQIIKEIK